MEEQEEEEERYRFSADIHLPATSSQISVGFWTAVEEKLLPKERD